MRRHPNTFEQAKLYTTRTRREGDTATDRIFVSSQEFEELRKKGVFIIAEEFGGNWYGFTKDSVMPKDKHLLVNIWPWLSEDFAKMKHTLLVGMMPPNDWESMLVERMKKRGDTDETIEKRKKLIQKDINDLVEQSRYIQGSGKMFEITSDDTIQREIIPWIEKQLNL